MTVTLKNSTIKMSIIYLGASRFKQIRVDKVDV